MERTVATERAVRRRWAERDVTTRILTPEDPGARQYVLHCAPHTRVADDRDAGAVPALVFPDVIARHRAMSDAAVTIVAGDDALAGTGSPRLDERLACLPCSERYDTTDPSYVDSVWWALVQLWEAGLLFEAPHRFGWCGDCSVADERPHGRVRADVTSALVRFPVAGDTALRRVGASLLVDVVAPWTVPAATAVRIDAEHRYVLAQAAGDDYPVVLARTAVSAALGVSATIHRDVPADELLAERYASPGVAVGTPGPPQGGPVVAVARAEGTRTGLAPVAPGCAADDWRTAADHGLPVVDVIGADGRLSAAAGRYAGVAVGDADRVVLEDLQARGLALRIDRRSELTDACARCGGALVARSRPAWLVATTRVRDRLRTERGTVAGLSPTTACRAWATGDGDWPIAHPGTDGPELPLWRCARCARITAIDSREALFARGRDPQQDAATAEPGHADGQAAGPTDREAARPSDRELACPGCTAGTARRVPYAVDRLLVAAAMPFARFGFPAEPGSDTDVAHRARANLLIDAAAPRGAWTDAVIALSVLLWDAAGHEATVRVGHSLARTVRHAATVPTVSHLLDRHGVDAVRLAVLTEPRSWRAGRRREASAAAARDSLDALLRAADTATAAARAWRSFDPVQAPAVDQRGVLDRWILAELSDTVSRARHLLDVRDIQAAGRRILRFVADLTGWYVPQQRRAPARTGDELTSPAQVAGATMHECLVTVAALLAPLAPAVGDALYEALVRRDDPAAPASVHLLRYPTPDPTARDDAVREAMGAARRIIGLGRRARHSAGLERDRPLPCAAATVTTGIAGFWDTFTPLLSDALRVSRIVPLATVRGGPTDPPTGHVWRTVCDGALVVAVAVPDEARRESGPTVHGEPVPLGDVPIRTILREVATG